MDEGVVDEVVAALRAGGLVALPTDTVYGLAALPGDGGAVDRLFALKGRGQQVPIAVLCVHTEQAMALADGGRDRAVDEAAARWWPGPLTLVVPRRPGLDLHLGEPETTIGVRVPDHPLVQAVAARVGPLATTSANRHGQPTPVTADGVREALGPSVTLVVDGGALVATASTVIDTTSRPWKVLRHGAVDPDEVLALAVG